MSFAAVNLTAQASTWSGTQLALGFGMPLAVILVGLTIFVGGRAERTALRVDAEPVGGFGGPPGSSDVGDAEGFGVERTRQLMHAATRKVLIGLCITLGGSLALLGVTAAKIIS